MRSTFNILFYLKKNSVKKTGFAPLMVRITINGVSAPFSLKTEARPADWDAKSGRLQGRSKEANALNSCIGKTNHASRTSFYRCFKAKYDMSPRDFRNLAKK